MISISNLDYFIGDRPIYHEASLHIKPKDKIGLIGLNGTGKSTLLRIINNEITPDSGMVSMPNDCTVGYLNQDLLSYQSDESILAVAMEAFMEAVKIEIEMEHILQKMEQDYSDDLMHRLSHLQEKYETMGGYALQSKAEEILEGIGFQTEDLHRPLREFSGGWRMRVMLARLLLEQPSLLMLDEPTNHLDLPSIQWIEKYLRTYEGAIIVVSHDRQFLDNTIDTIVEVSQYDLNRYEGNYSFYEQEKALRQEVQQNAYENQQQKIKQTERFIERFRAKATKARQVQSRVKALEKMDMVEEVNEANAAINFKFNFNRPSGKHVVRIENLHKQYGEQVIFNSADALIERGDKIALIGANGKGKSTLLRIIGDLEPFEGKRYVGHNVHQAFYAQHQIEGLHIENDIISELMEMNSGKSEQELRGLLGCFLFSGDDIYKKIKVLSGGEKSRVALAKTLISEANFLLLDEPTNHLDMMSVNILIQALNQYEGTLILVSHDRYFISQVANKIWHIKNEQIKSYPGNYQDYQWWAGQQQAESVQDEDIPKKQTPKPKNPSVKTDTVKELQKDIRQLKKSIEILETEIMVMEEHKTALEEELGNPSVFSDVDKLAQKTQKFQQIENEIAKKTNEWEDCATQLGDKEKQLENQNA
jgi:ATP-binding cassette subfamily F protein 3